MIIICKVCKRGKLLFRLLRNYYSVYHRRKAHYRPTGKSGGKSTEYLEVLLERRVQNFLKPNLTKLARRYIAVGFRVRNSVETTCTRISGAK